MTTTHLPTLQALQGAADAAPGNAQAQLDLGHALRTVGRHAQATARFQRALMLDPHNDAIHLLCLLHKGTWLDEQGQPEAALVCFQQAVERHPQSADAWATLGTVQAHLSAPAEAAQSLQRALQIEPGRTDVMERFGIVLQDQGRFEDAALVFERLMQLEPLRPLIPGRLLHCKMLIADWTALDLLQRRVEQALAAGQLSSEPFGLQGCCASPALLGKAARQYAAQRYPDASAGLPPARVGTHADGRIRIGYLAGEFRDQATSMLLTEVLERHDRSRFEVVAFDNGWDDGSALRQRIAAAVDIVPIRRVENDEVVRRIRARCIDVLVNLNGYFGQARQHVFARRPAAVQVNYLGFPGTIGAPYIDYIVADRVVIPPDHQAHYAEQVVYLPDSYQPNDAQRRVADWPTQRADIGLPEEAFVFCCMNNIYKIMPAVFSIWMRLLRRVPGSVLLLYSAVPEAQLNLRTEAQARGVDPQRLHFGVPLRNDQHLARLRLTDLFLDTLPYNAHTTGSDALWAGLPLLTCLGTAFAGRVGASLLRAVGLPELVTESLAGYEALAYKLATEPALLQALRAKLAAQLQHAPLYNSARTTRHLEAAYTQMVRRAQQGLPAQTFAVAASP